VNRVLVRPDAAADIESAFLWYERQHGGLGAEFLAALQATIQSVTTRPEAFPIVHRTARRALVQRRFPYGLFYRIDGTTIVVIACMHAKRRPDRWKGRLGKRPSD
jgi:toxin ParE1/3/4